MILVLLTVTGGVLAGWALGGRLTDLGRVRLHGTGFLVAAVLARLLLAVDTLVAPALRGGLVVSSHLVVLAFVWANRRLPGMALVGLGAAANALVIAVNGAMPLSEEALGAVSGRPHGPVGPHHILVDPAEGAGRLLWLGDVLGIRWLGTVVSPGDVVLAAGAGLLVAHLMRRGARSGDRAVPAARRARRRRARARLRPRGGTTGDRR